MPEGDEFHKYEVVDRSHSVFTLLGELLGEHPMIECDPELKAAYEKALDGVYALYCEAGRKYL